MNAITGYVLFLVGSFALIIGMFALPSYQSYTGALVILFYIVGLFYAWWNAIRQTRKMAETKEEKEVVEPPKVSQEQHA